MPYHSNLYSQTDEEQLVHVSVSGILQEDLSQLPRSKSTDFFVKKLLLPKNPHDASVCDKTIFFRDQISFLDIASARPLVTIGSQAFVGEYEDAVGTSVFFKQSPAKGARDPVFGRQPATQVSYLEHTRKKLQLKRVFLNKKPKLDAKNTEPPNSDQKSPKPSCSPPER